MVRGDVDDLSENFRAVEGAGGVVGVDEDDGLGPIGDLVADVVDVWLPVFMFVAAVANRDGVVEFGEERVLGVGGSGDEEFVAGVEAGVEDHLESFGDTGGEADVVHGVSDVVAVFFSVDDGLSEFFVSFGGGVAIEAVTGRLVECVLDVLGGVEVVGVGVSDVEVEDFDALFFEF